MGHKAVLLFSLFLCLPYQLIAWSAAPADPSGSPQDALNRDFVDIEGLTDLRALLTREEGWFWLKTGFQAVDDGAFLLYGTSLGWTAWLNGEKIANSGSGPPFWHPSSGLPVLVRSPKKPGTENEILMKIYLRHGYTKAPLPLEFGKSDRLEQRRRLVTLISRGIPLTSFILGIVVFLIFLTGGPGRKGSLQSAFGLFGFFTALLSLETVFSAIPQLPVYVPWTALTLLVKTSQPFTMIFWRRAISMAGGKDSPALTVLDFLAAVLSAFWISAPLTGYPLIPLQFRGYFGFDPMPWLALYTTATALALWLFHSTRPHPGRAGTLLVFLLGIVPSLLLFVLNKSGGSLLSGFLGYGLPLSLVAVFVLQVGIRRVVPGETDAGDEVIETLMPVDDENDKPGAGISENRQTRLIRGVRSTLYPVSIPWDPVWDIASVRQGSQYPSTGFHDLYLDSSGHLEGFSFMDCGNDRLEGLLFNRLVQREFRRCFHSGSTLADMVRTVNKKSLQAAGAAGTKMSGIAGRFENESLTFISLSAHPLLLRRGKSRKVVYLTDGTGKNPAIGKRDAGSEGLKTAKVLLSKNDMTLIFTPGIIGLETPAGVPLGMERLSTALAGSGGKSAEMILADITGGLKNFCGKEVVPMPLQMLLLRRR